jgi:hypothetical protein
MEKPTIRLTDQQFYDAKLLAFFSFVMAKQADPLAHFHASVCFAKLQARARRSVKFTVQRANRGLNKRSQAGLDKAQADIDGLVSYLAGYSGAPERMRLEHQDDGSIKLHCEAETLILGL